VVSAANLNSPGQTVISGAKAAVERAAALCKEAGAKRTVMLPVSAPVPLRADAAGAGALARDLAGLEFRDPAFPVAANVSATLVTTGDAGARGAGCAGDRSGALGGVHRIAGGDSGERARRSSSRWGRDAC
jgi:malonyl CoA-acyl carrier protein transacylase